MALKLPFMPDEKKTLAELQEQEEYKAEEDRTLSTDISIEKKRLLLKKIRERGDDPSWFSTEHGFNWGAMAKRLGFK